MIRPAAAILVAVFIYVTMRDTPSASAANITERCDTDLSPGMASVPCRAEPLRAIQ